MSLTREQVEAIRVGEAGTDERDMEKIALCDTALYWMHRHEEYKRLTGPELDMRDDKIGPMPTLGESYAEVRDLAAENRKIRKELARFYDMDLDTDKLREKIRDLTDERDAARREAEAQRTLRNQVDEWFSSEGESTDWHADQEYSDTGDGEWCVYGPMSDGHDHIYPRIRLGTYKYMAESVAKCMNRASDAIRENRELRTAIGALAELAHNGMEIDGGDFEDVMVKHGLFVKVPADAAFREEWDADEMYVLAWTEIAEENDGSD